jgi:two-component system nitrogen regulation response regulator GlnG
MIVNDTAKVQETLAALLGQAGNANIHVIKQGSTVSIMQEEEMRSLVSIEDKVLDLEEELYSREKGRLYDAVLARIEKPLLEYVLERTEGNQLKAARILGMNRNTIRAKIKKLAIDVQRWKQIL